MKTGDEEQCRGDELQHRELGSVMKNLWIAFASCLLAGTAHAQSDGVSGASSASADTGASNVIGAAEAGYKLYVGVDYQWMTLSVLNSPSVGGFTEQHY